MIGSKIIFYFFCCTLFIGCQNHSGKQGICNMGNNINKEKMYVKATLVYLEVGSRDTELKFDWVTNKFNVLNKNVKKGRISSTNITEGEEDPFTHYNANGQRLSTESGQK